MTSTQFAPIFKAIKEIDIELTELLITNIDSLQEEDLMQIQYGIAQRKEYLNQIDANTVASFIQHKEKEWQDLEYRTHKLVELATYCKDDIKHRIEKRGRAKRSIVTYQKFLN